jgi:poly-gamma-glutamate capsule biosynthesis protein CapA/YwtB (metallophosphatase superfamily)
MVIPALLVSALAAAAPSPAPTSAPPPAADLVASTVTIATVGHIVMGSSYPPSHPDLPPGDGRGLFDAVLPALSSADLRFGNLAAPLSDRGATAKKVDGVNTFAFRTPPAFTARLVEAGFDVLQAANNHIRDFGPDAYADTLAQLDRAHIGHVGRQGELFVKTVRGLRIGVLGFTQPYTEEFATHHDLPAATAAVRAARASVDVLVVGLHGGTEGPASLHTPRGEEWLGSEYRGKVVEAARALVEAGADLVVGFGPHLPRAMELHRGKLIAYSLGNFLTWGPFNLRGPNGLTLVLLTTFDAQGTLVAARIEPMVVEKPGLPRPDGERRTIAHLRQLSRQDFPESAPDFADDGTICLADPSAGPPRAGEPPAAAQPPR